jgi:hypothetical protein
VSRWECNEVDENARGMGGGVGTCHCVNIKINLKSEQFLDAIWPEYIRLVSAHIRKYTSSCQHLDPMLFDLVWGCHIPLWTTSTDFLFEILSCWGATNW